MSGWPADEAPPRRRRAARPSRASRRGSRACRCRAAARRARAPRARRPAARGEPPTRRLRAATPPTCSRSAGSRSSSACRSTGCGLAAGDLGLVLLGVQPLVGDPERSSAEAASSGRKTQPNEVETSKPSPVSVSASSCGRETSRAWRSRRSRGRRTRRRQAGRRARGRRGTRELLAEPGEQRVAGRVPEGVVVALEAVEVVEDEQPLAGFPGLEGVVEVGEQPATVPEPGERVGRREQVDALGHLRVLAEGQHRAGDHRHNVAAASATPTGLRCWR